MKANRVAGTCALLVSLVATLSSCSSSGDPAQSADPPIDTASLCVSSQCGTKVRLLTIPGAENTLFTPEGRLFVSGTSNVYEVTKDSSGFHATSLFAGSGNFMGMALVGSTLYVACSSDEQLYAADISTGAPVVSPIAPLTGFQMPNGMAADAAGNLYITDGPFSLRPKIARFKIDPADPIKVLSQDTWIQFSTDLPNGIERVGQTLYITMTSLLPPNLAEVATIAINADGSPGGVEKFGSAGLSLPDDLHVVQDDVLVALYSEGAIALVGPSGKLVLQTLPLSFSFPSSVKPGMPPMFSSTDLVVTEKGPLGVSNPSGSPLLGSALTLFQKNP